MSKKILVNNLKESELKYRKLINLANDAIFVADAETGIIIDANIQAGKLLGLPLEKIIGINQTQIHPQEEAERYRNLFKEAIKKGHEVIGPLYVRHKKGKNIPVEISSNVVEIGGKKIIQGIFRDITERLKMETAIEQNERKFRSIFDTSSEFIGLLDTKGLLIEANKTALDLIGAKAESVCGKYFWETPCWSNLKNAQKKLKDAVKKASRNELVRFETEHRGKNGKIISVDFSLKPVINPEGKVEKIITEGRDITDKTQLEELKKEFLSLAAHELKTPVTTLKLISQAHIAKLKRYGSDQLRLEELEIVDRELERLTQLINDILDDTRIESGKLFLKLEQTNLNKLIFTVIKKMSLLSKKHKILTHKPLEKISLVVDQQRIEQVLVNLISNAIKYSNPGSKIEVGVKTSGAKVLVWVKDQGFGIPKSHQEKIFDRFYQVQEKEARGFGLGLYITKRIIEQHKGKIWVESEVGEGSTFYLSLPLRKI